jgi:Family of unknown function (DUF6152)
MRRLAAVVIGISSPALVQSHHNSAPLYDFDESVTVEGVVAQVRFVNPHARIYFEVTDDEGKAVLWMAEGANPMVLRRWGWTGEEMKPGDRVRITGAPSRDGSPMVEWRTITLPDGTELGGGNGFPAERDRLLERLEQQRRATGQDED